ncbi:MAG: hypothetical protein ACSLE8_17760, partial [Rhodococcus sp. (in: high G+C Gram-positive bacteria)]
MQRYEVILHGAQQKPLRDVAARARFFSMTHLLFLLSVPLVIDLTENQRIPGNESRGAGGGGG